MLRPGGRALKRLREEWWQAEAERARKRGREAAEAVLARGRRGWTGGEALGGGEGRNIHGRAGANKQCWVCSGFREGPGEEKEMEGSYRLGRVEVEVAVRGAAGEERWLGVELVRAGGSRLGWVRAEEPRVKVGGKKGWERALRMCRGRSGWGSGLDVGVLWKQRCKFYFEPRVSKMHKYGNFIIEYPV